MKISINVTDENDISHKLHQAKRESGLSNQEIVKILEQKFGEKISVSVLSHNIWRGSVRFRRALMILSKCGVTEIEISS